MTENDIQEVGQGKIESSYHKINPSLITIIKANRFIHKDINRLKQISDCHSGLKVFWKYCPNLHNIITKKMLSSLLGVAIVDLAIPGVIGGLGGLVVGAI